MGEIISTVTGWIWTIAIFILFIAMLALILIADGLIILLKQDGG